MTIFLVLGILSFGLGVALNSFLNIGFYSIFFLFGLGLFFGLFYFFLNKKFFVFLTIFFLMAGAGMFRYELKDERGISSGLKPFALLEGVIVSEPENKENYSRFVMKTGKGDKILIFSNRFPEFAYGDRVLARGKLEKPKNFGDFDWPSYLAKDDIFLQLYYPKINLLSKGEGNFLKQKLFALKRKYTESLNSLLPEPHSSLMAGITVGEKESMDKELLENFRKTGIIHIVVLSGYNVTIVADNIARFFQMYFSKLMSAFLGLAGIFFFAVLTGLSATVVRASIMAGLVYLARATGRVYEATIALLIAGFVMILVNPKILRYDASFQLSFLATIGLIFLAPRLENYFYWLPDKWRIKEYALSTLSAQAMISPFLLQSMGTFSLSALPVNLLILIFIPITMFFGFLAGVIGWFSPLLSLIPSSIAYLLLSYELWIVSVFSKIPLSQITFSSFPFYLTILFYIFIAGFIIYKKPIR